MGQEQGGLQVKQLYLKLVEKHILKYVMTLVLLFGSALSLPIHLEADEYKPGFCPISGRQIIDNYGRTLPNYAIIWFELDNGSRMPVAVDKGASVIEADFERIMEHVKDGWDWEIRRKKWTPEEIQDYKNTFFNLKIKRIIE